jgi:catechol 1,2-dioxygenase
MASQLVNGDEIQGFLDRIAGLDNAGGGDRAKRILRRVVGDLFATIDEFDVSEDEFWAALNFLAAGAPELGLWAAGLGFERFLDIRMDIADQKAGLAAGTPRTIEGPLYVAGAPLSQGFARLDDGSEPGEAVVMHGQVRDTAGAPVPGAVVDVWHANRLGAYSHFDPSQGPYNLRRRIATDGEGRYKFRTTLPSGYSVPPGGTTDRLLQAVGRHGNRPAHIHFFVSAPGHVHLTTQINIAGDPYTHDDFAYATRDELITDAVRRDDPAALAEAGLNAPFLDIAFDFTLAPARGAREQPSARARK